MSDGPAERFLVSRIVAQSVQEGSPLNGEELATLGDDADVPAELALDEERWEMIEARIVGLLKRSYSAETTEEALYAYHEAAGSLSRSSYLRWLARRAGICEPTPTWKWVSLQAGLFAILVVPGVVSITMAALLIWGALNAASPGKQGTEMAVAACMLGGFGALLVALWRREAVAQTRRRRTRS